MRFDVMLVKLLGEVDLRSGWLVGNEGLEGYVRVRREGGKVKNVWGDVYGAYIWGLAPCLGGGSIGLIVNIWGRSVKRSWGLKRSSWRGFAGECGHKWKVGSRDSGLLLRGSFFDC